MLQKREWFNQDRAVPASRTIASGVDTKMTIETATPSPPISGAARASVSRDRGDVAEGADGGPSLHLHVVIASETVERSLDISPEPTCAPL